jgi:hypothetical protein
MMLLPLYKRFSFGNACIACVAATQAFNVPHYLFQDYFGKWMMDREPTYSPALPYIQFHVSGVCTGTDQESGGVTLHSAGSALDHPKPSFLGYNHSDFLALVDKAFQAACDANSKVYLRAILGRSHDGLYQLDWAAIGFVMAEELHVCICPDGDSYFLDDATDQV